MDFTQVNAGINRDMLSRAVELLAPEKSDRILDLFCGLGNFSLPMASRAGHVVGIEGADTMVKRAYENAAANNLENTEFYCCDLTRPLTDHEWSKQEFNKVLLDPPRSGAHEILNDIAGMGPEKIVYVSCNPSTLARDAGELAKLGYKLTKCGVMDLFPHTTHVESIALFIPAKS